MTFTAIAALLSISGPAAAQQNEGGSPAQPEWRLRASAHDCLLMGQLSPGEAYMAIEAIVGTDDYRFAVGGHDLRESTTASLFPVAILFHDADARFDRRGSSSVLPQGGTMIQVRGVGEDLVQALTRASSLSLERRGKTYGPYSFHDAGKAVAALEACVNDRLAAWGADPDQFKPGGTKPVALQHRDDWIPNDTMLRLAYFISGSDNALTALMRISIAEDGRVDGCTRLEGPEDATFEKMACSPILSKQLFRPAHDPAGKPVRGTAFFEIRLASAPR